MTISHPILATKAYLAVLTTMEANNDKGESWRLTSAAEHLRHATAHLASYKVGDREEDHLGHAMTRIAMAMEIEKAIPK